MTVLERIKATCKRKKNISITTLEQILGYSNGSLAKAKDIPSGRIIEIAQFLNTTTDYLLTGEMSKMQKLVEDEIQFSTMDDIVKEYALKLDKLPEDKRNLIFNMIEQLEK